MCRWKNALWRNMVMDVPKIRIAEKLLDVKKVLFSYEIPILFVCSIADESYFLVYCSDIDELTYSIARTSLRKIVSMLKNEIAMSVLFDESNEKYKLEVDNFTVSCEAQPVCCFNEFDTPRKDAMYGKLTESVNEYLNEISEIRCSKTHFSFISIISPHKIMKSRQYKRTLDDVFVIESDVCEKKLKKQHKTYIHEEDLQYA